MGKGKHNPMGVRERFSQNLRRFCATKKSHAQVARDLGINRQQFNNYITGKNLPNESVIDNICRYFDVDLQEMFCAPEETKKIVLFENLPNYHKNMSDLIYKREIGNRKNRINDGIYFIHFKLPYRNGGILRSLMAIKEKEGFSFFRRITSLNINGIAPRPNAQSLHVGIAFYRNNGLFLFGFDRFDDLMPSFLFSHTVPSSEILFAGLGSVRVGFQFLEVPFVITSAPRNRKVADLLPSLSTIENKDVGNQDEISTYLENFSSNFESLFNHR